MNISVGIVISYETDEVIDNCLTSIFNSLKFANSLVNEYEVIVVASSIWKNSSTGIYKNVKFIQSDSNNLAANRNHILRLAKYEAIYFTDPDCQLEQSTIYNLIFASRQTEIKDIFAIAGANISKYSDRSMESFFHFLASCKILNLGSSQIAVRQHMITDWHSPTCNILYFSRHINSETFNTKYYSYGEDLEFNFRIHKKTKKNILIVNNAPVAHSQFKSFKNLIEKCFGYGMAQTHLLKSHWSSYLNKRIWSLFVVLVWIASLLIFGSTVSNLLIFLLGIFYLLVFTIEIFLQRKLKSYFQWLLIHFTILFSYLSGQVFAIFTRRSKRIFASTEMQ